MTMSLSLLCTSKLRRSWFDRSQFQRTLANSIVPSSTQSYVEGGRSGLYSGSMPNCSVRGTRFEPHHRQLCLSRQPLRWAWAGKPLLQYLGRLLTFHRMVKWVSAFGPSNNNKWRWYMWEVASYRRTHSPTWLSWFKGCRPLVAQSYIQQMNLVNFRSGCGLPW